MDKRRTNSTPLVITVVLLIALLSALYVLSYGPFLWCASHGYISDSFHDGFFSRFYAPINWLDAKCPPFSSAFEWYLELFVDFKRTPTGQR
jgi:hypothetical protein